MMHKIMRMPTKEKLEKIAEKFGDWIMARDNDYFSGDDMTFCVEVLNGLKGLSPWKKAKIVKCTDPDYWYIDKVGGVILVKPSTDPNSGFVEAKNGSSVWNHDLEYIAKP